MLTRKLSTPPPVSAIRNLTRHWDVKGDQVDYFVVTGSIWGGRGDHLKCRQWLLSNQSDYLSISMDHVQQTHDVTLTPTLRQNYVVLT